MSLNSRFGLLEESRGGGQGIASPQDRSPSRWPREKKAGMGLFRWCRFGRGRTRWRTKRPAVTRQEIHGKWHGLDEIWVVRCIVSTPPSKGQSGYYPAALHLSTRGWHSSERTTVCFGKRSYIPPRNYRTNNHSHFHASLVKLTAALRSDQVSVTDDATRTRTYIVET